MYSKSAVQNREMTELGFLSGTPKSMREEISLGGISAYWDFLLPEHLG